MRRIEGNYFVDKTLIYVTIRYNQERGSKWGHQRALEFHQEATEY